MAPFNIKIISDNNLILVESCGYKSEMFKPEIIDGVIHLNNVINQQRKTTVLEDSSNKIKALSVQKVKNALPSKLMSVSGSFHSTANGTPKGDASNTQSSLASAGYFSANSVETPPVIRACSKGRVKHSTPVLLPDLVLEQNFTPPYKNFATSCGKQQEFHLRSSSSFTTPSPINSRLSMPKPKIVSLSSLSPNLKVVKLYRKSTENGSQDIAKIIHISNIPKKNTTFATPVKSAKKPPGPETPKTVTKWRKCITPARTYSKRGNIQKKQLIIRNVKKVDTLSYIQNSTVGIAGSAEVTVKTIRTAIDQRTTIGPKQFKQQMKSSDDLKNTYTFNVRTREEFYHARFSAFDLLVNPIRKKSLSEKLRQMFSIRCTEKSAAVELKFKPILDDIPPLDYIPPARKRFKF